MNIITRQNLARISDSVAIEAHHPSDLETRVNASTSHEVIAPLKADIIKISSKERDVTKKLISLKLRYVRLTRGPDKRFAFKMADRGLSELGQAILGREPCQLPLQLEWYGGDKLTLGMPKKDSEFESCQSQWKALTSCEKLTYSSK
ncbi:hypothetical protein RRG08_037965 [Elysia crispata]|uniref:Uncharacterized protein n=1 Tax=Elysia crispata TaxID=231223 RepID=A0AAE1ACC6_9GAST|nr:hypothetical protein RRG08_037965 [Elysia crispata]